MSLAKADAKSAKNLSSSLAYSCTYFFILRSHSRACGTRQYQSVSTVTGRTTQAEQYRRPAGTCRSLAFCSNTTKQISAAQERARSSNRARKKFHIKTVHSVENCHPPCQRAASSACRSPCPRTVEGHSSSSSPTCARPAPAHRAHQRGVDDNMQQSQVTLDLSFAKLLVKLTIFWADRTTGAASQMPQCRNTQQKHATPSTGAAAQLARTAEHHARAPSWDAAIQTTIQRTAGNQSPAPQHTSRTSTQAQQIYKKMHTPGSRGWRRWWGRWSRGHQSRSGQCGSGPVSGHQSAPQSPENAKGHARATCSQLHSLRIV